MSTNLFAFRVDSFEDGFRPSSFQRILQLFSNSKDATKRSFLTSVNTAGRSLGNIGATLPEKNQDETISRSSQRGQSENSQFAPRILSLNNKIDQDDAFSFAPVSSSIQVQPAPSVTPPNKLLNKQQSTINNINVQDVSDKDKSVPISTVIPAILSAMNEKSTTPRQKTALISLLSDMVETVRTSSSVPPQSSVKSSIPSSARQQKQRDAKIPGEFHLSS